MEECHVTTKMNHINLGEIMTTLVHKGKVIVLVEVPHQSFTFSLSLTRGHETFHFVSKELIGVEADTILDYRSIIQESIRQSDLPKIILNTIRERMKVYNHD